jgi:hypothetical protein
LAATPATKIGDEALPTGAWIVVVSPVEMDDGRTLNWHPPQPVAFSLVEAKRPVVRAMPRRRQIIGNLKLRPDEAYEPPNSRATLDVVADLSSAVWAAFTAVEAIANDSIDQLPEDAVVEIGRKGEKREVPQPEMVRRLSLDEKLSLVVPLLDIGEQIKGTRPWDRYLHLKGLRDDLVHVKERGYSPNPHERTAYDRLLLGDGDSCSRDAFEIVEAARPGFLAAHVVEHLSH